MQQPPSATEVAEAAFQELEQEATAHIEAHGSPMTASVTLDAALLRLQHLYGKNWLNALRIVDEFGVLCFTAYPSGKQVYQVKARSSGEPYLVFPHHYCSCQAFFYEVVCKGDAICCKHQLAARLAAALHRCRSISISDMAMAQMLMQSIA